MALVDADLTTAALFIKAGLIFLGAIDGKGKWLPTTAPTADSEFWIETACREFQRYTRMPKVATFNDQPATAPYPLRLKQRDNDLGKCVAVDGNFRDPAMLAILQKWSANNICIPVVISAWRTDAKHQPIQLLRGIHTDNLWLAHQFEPGRHSLDIDGKPIGKREHAVFFALDLFRSVFNRTRAPSANRHWTIQKEGPPRT